MHVRSGIAQMIELLMLHDDLQRCKSMVLTCVMWSSMLKGLRWGPSRKHSRVEACCGLSGPTVGQAHQLCPIPCNQHVTRRMLVVMRDAPAGGCRAICTWLPWSIACPTPNPFVRLKDDEVKIRS